MVISHHPLVFKGLKRFTGSSYVDRTLIKAIKNDVAIYAIHTNLDNIIDGVNKTLADKLRLENRSILAPIPGIFDKNGDPVGAGLVGEAAAQVIARDASGGVGRGVGVGGCGHRQSRPPHAHADHAQRGNAYLKRLMRPRND